MLLKIVDNGEFKDMPIKEGEMFLLPGTSKTDNWAKFVVFVRNEFSLIVLLPSHLSLSPINTHCLANTPHNPVRFENTVGIVIEKQRPAEALGNDSPGICGFS